jgi:adenosine deaminase
MSENKRPIDFFQILPKVDLHRHMEGSIRLRTLLDVRREHGMPLPGTGQLDELVQIRRGDEYSFQNFLSKFQTLRQFYKTPEVIERITRETIADAATDNVRYLELRFTPVALSRVENFPLDEVIDWVVNAAQQAEVDFGVTTRLIVSMNRHESLALAEQAARLAGERISQGIVGLDLAGDEANHPGLEFAGVFREARQSGLHITIHAGEWASAHNVMDAILHLGAERIGHGVRVLEDPDTVALARERVTPFEVCLTSNIQSGVVSTSQAHPLARMLDAGLNATLNTDDPSISQITLSDEYRYACEDLEIGMKALTERIVAAARAAFLPEHEKTALAETLQTELSVHT